MPSENKHLIQISTRTELYTLFSSIIEFSLLLIQSRRCLPQVRHLQKASLTVKLLVATCGITAVISLLRKMSGGPKRATLFMTFILFVTPSKEKE